jgi:hypothetical protein
MIQEVLALITVAGAIVYMVWGIYRAVKPDKNQQNTFCSGCSAGGCTPKVIKQKAKNYQ